jgi:choline dehydrogenase-like flavoprotein
MSGSIRNVSGATELPKLTVDVCVIGSGCGGATAAWELAKAGKHVLVLEEGGDFTGAQLTQRDGQMYDQLYMDRGGRTTSDLGISILQGRVLGGGGVINACDVVPLSDQVLQHWRSRYGLTDFTPQALGPARDAALVDLAANQPGDGDLNDNNRILRDGARALGWRGEIMRHNRVGCGGVGTCLIGCPRDAKRNPRFVAIPAAVAAGAQVLLRTRVVRINDALQEMKQVQVRTLDGRGYHEQQSFTVRARTVVVAANPTGTAELLLRSGIGNEHVGRHVSLQPQLPITAVFDREVRSFRGIPQSYAVTEFEDLSNEEHGWWGYRIEAIAGTPGIVASLLPAVGPGGQSRMAKYAHLASSLLLLPDEPQGTVRVERSGRLRVDYALTEEQVERFRSAVKSAARLYLAMGASEVFVPVSPPVTVRSEREIDQAVNSISFRPASAPLISAHQQGGVRFAPSAKAGAADPTGLVYGTNGIYVFDSSGFPTSSSSHTMAPIITMSRFLAQRVAASFKS